MKGIFSLLVISQTLSAILKAIFSFSIAQGPAIRKNCPELICLIFGMF
jgi:hypothetical protein